MDDSDELARYQMIWLKSCLKGKAEESISKLSFSDEAYKESKILSNKGLEVKEDDFRIIFKSWRKLNLFKNVMCKSLTRLPIALLRQYSGNPSRTLNLNTLNLNLEASSLVWFQRDFVMQILQMGKRAQSTRMAQRSERLDNWGIRVSSESFKNCQRACCQRKNQEGRQKI